jgi:hypothetical protein
MISKKYIIIFDGNMSDTAEFDTRAQALAFAKRAGKGKSCTLASRKERSK